MMSSLKITSYLAKNYTANNVTYDDVINTISKVLENCVTVYPNAEFELSATFDLDGGRGSVKSPSPR